MIETTFQATCPSAKELENLLKEGDPGLLDGLLSAPTPSDLNRQLKQQGIDLEACDRYQVLRVVRDTITALSEDDLAQVAGGEIAKTTKAVLTATAVAGSVVAVGVAGGIAGGTAGAVLDYNQSH